MPHMVTAHHTNETLPQPWTIESKIALHVTRVRDWQLDPAEKCLAVPNAAFAVLAIVTSYFESVGRILSGDLSQQSAEDNFGTGIRHVFPELRKGGDEDEALIRFLYNRVRVGLYHHSTTWGGFLISGVHPFLFLMASPSRSGGRARIALWPPQGRVVRGRKLVQQWPRLTGDPDSQLQPRVSHDAVWCNPHLLIAPLQQHLTKLETDLRDPGNEDLRCNFERFFDMVSAGDDQTRIKLVREAEVARKTNRRP